MGIFDDEVIQRALEDIRGFCLTRNYTIAVAESVTSGMIQLALSCCENAGLFYAGGITAYSCFQKQKQLDISVEVCDESEGVSERIAEAMAWQVCRKFNCELGLGITGFASPIPEKGLTELYAYASFCYNGEIVFTKQLVPQGGTPLEIQQQYASSMLLLCSERLKLLA
jgi:nicotinamide-nucleotide amidase